MNGFLEGKTGKKPSLESIQFNAGAYTTYQKKFEYMQELLHLTKRKSWKQQGTGAFTNLLPQMVMDIG